MPADFREIIEQQQFKEDKRKLRHSAKRLDEILDGVTWTLTRLPECYPNIPETDVYLAKTDAFSDVPALYVWFTFDENYVYLEGIEEAPIPE